MNTLAVILEKPEQLVVSDVDLLPPGNQDVVVDVHWSGISTGTERLLWSGKMPPFPGMGYPLVPGYEAVGEIVEAGPQSGRSVGQQVFVPGARCYRMVNGLFGGAAARLVAPGHRTTVIHDSMGEEAVLLALAATAYHAISHEFAQLPDLIIGHGVLGRLLARLALAMDERPPVVWETDARRRQGAQGYSVIAPQADERRDYTGIYDVSGDSGILDTLVPRLKPGGEIVLAGFYSGPMQFQFAPAFMREARMRIAAEWKPEDLAAVLDLIEEGVLCLDGLITHHHKAAQAASAYSTAFNDPECLKMILDWREIN